MIEYCYEELSFQQILWVISQSCYCRIGMSQNDQPYVVPMNFKYRVCDNNIVFKLKSLDSGEKMSMMHCNDNVCLEFDIAGRNGVYSVIVFGTVRIVESPDPCSDMVQLIVYNTSVTGRKYFYGERR